MWHSNSRLATVTSVDLERDLSPGDETSIVDPGGASNRIKPDATWYNNIHRYQFYASLMLGGDAVLLPPPGTLHPISGQSLDDNSYLQRLPGETSVQKGGTDRGKDGWQRRRDAGCHDPVAARIVWTYVDTVFRQTVDRASVENLLGAEVLRDVDGKGTDAEDWLAWAYAQGLSQGWMLGQVDMPSASPGEHASAAHQDAAAGRPYVQLIPPVRVWQCYKDHHGRVEHALIHEATGRWREWFPTYSVVHTVPTDGDGHRYVDGDELKSKGQPVVTSEEIPHAFGEVPLVLFLANDPNPHDPYAPPGESAMKATGLFDLRILQHLSLLDDLLRKTGFAILHIRDDPDGSGVAEEYVLGNGFILASDADVNWKAPDADLARVLWEHITNLESEALKVGGVHRRSQDSVEAHSGLSIDYENAPIYATVQRWARRLREWELRLWRLMAKGMSKAVPEDFDVIYPDDFSSRPVQQDLDAAKELLEPYESFDAAPEFVQVSVMALHRRAIARMIGSDPEVSKALKEPLVPDEPDEPTEMTEPTEGDDVTAPVEEPVPGEEPDEED